MQLADNALHWSARRMLFNGGIFVFWVIVFVAVALLGADWLLRPVTYPVKRISFAGPFERVSQKELETAALTNLAGSFITADLGAAKERVEALPWVDRAWISRRWPNAVHVRFSEQNFVARWGDTAWLSDRGTAVLLPNRDGPKDVPQLLGPPGSELQVLEFYQKFQTHLATAELSIRRLELTPRRMWKLYLDNGVELVIGRKGMEERVERFIQIYPFMLKANRRIRRVDLRYANGLAVAWMDSRKTFSRQRTER
ncbi:MAG: cell division protein FtsQ/DivIB [Acidiferrobacterales bacterium]